MSDSNRFRAVDDTPGQVRAFMVHAGRSHGFARATVRTYLNNGEPLSISTDFSTRHKRTAEALHADFPGSLGRLVEGHCPIHDAELARVDQWGHCRPCSRHWRTRVLEHVQVIDFEECPSNLYHVHCPGVEEVADRR
jgi:hypothetical protein